MRLAEIRRSKGLTQSQLGERSGYSVFHVSKLETGAVPISDSALVKLAVGLGMGIDDLGAVISHASSLRTA